jgi:NAD(P) transhydrogenase subunit alpha
LLSLLIVQERRAGETRVAATPETVRRLRGRGLSIQLERGAGVTAGYSDEDYAGAGAQRAARGARSEGEGEGCERHAKAWLGRGGGGEWGGG